MPAGVRMTHTRDGQPLPLFFALLVAGLSMIGPFSIDTYLPALPAIADSLGTSTIYVQQTLTAYMLPFAIMTLWHGALSDALGRRTVIFAGLALYVVASLLCAAGGRLEVLLMGRALQGLVAGAGMVVSRAMISDLLDGAAAQRLMAQVTIIFAASPAIAPILGGQIFLFFNWHGIFIFMALFGALMLALGVRYLPETLPQEKRQSIKIRDMVQAYRQIFGHGPFRSVSLTLAFNLNGMFIYALSAPVFLISLLRFGPDQFGWLFIPVIAGMMAGSWISGRLAGNCPARRTVALGMGIMLATALANVLISALAPTSQLGALLPMPFYALGMGLTTPSLQLMTQNYFPERRGMASSCQASIQTGLTVITGGIVAPLVWGSVLSLSLTSLAFISLGWLAFSLSGPPKNNCLRYP